MNEPEIIGRLRSGDNEAFREVVDCYRRMVYGCAYRFLLNEQSAEDITQEVFIEVFESISSFRGDAKLSTWIYRIAITKSLNLIKSRKRKKRLALITGFFGGESGETEQVVAEGSTPPEEMERKEMAAELTRALDKLPGNQKVAFLLSKNDGMSYQEICEVMNLSLPAVESLLHRAKANLRKLLFNYYKNIV